MPQALSSFLISVGIILFLALFVPCIESLARFLRRTVPRRESTLPQEPTATYSREIA